jgi:hypothetical protein
MATEAAAGVGDPRAVDGLGPGARLSIRSWPAARLATTIALITGLLGLATTIGADARWLAALGQAIVRRGSIPSGLPFAAAATGHWPNTLVLAELVFDGLEQALGDRGLIVAQLVAVALGLWILARDALADGAGSMGTSSALMLTSLGAIASLAIARVQLFSLVMFPLMLLLLRAEARNPSRRIWLALPLLAVWSNLHGAALCGLMILYGYLALERFRTDRLTAFAMVLAAPIAMSLTPAGYRTVDYYYGLVTNLAAERGVGQWAPLGQSPLDVVLVGAAILLVLRARHRRPALWELAVAVGLAALTVKASRDGVWLLFFLTGPAAHRTRVRRDWNGLIPVGAVLAIALLAFDVARPIHIEGASRAMVARAVALAHGSPILADGIPAEQIALAGGQIWAGNPLDAFSRHVQGLYLDWIAGDASGRPALANRRVEVVLVSRGSAAQRLTRQDGGFAQVAGDATAAVYLRRGAEK